MIDPVALTAKLIQCNSVTPNEGGALQLLESILINAGFWCKRIDRNNVPNMFARWGNESPVFGFNGHTDVVPAGDLNGWTLDPFSGEVKNGCIWGRGAADMKSGVAAFVAAAVNLVHNSPPKGSIIITITGDEEAIAKDGTLAILEWMTVHEQKMDICIVGEPTCPEVFGEAIKVGRRGSLSVKITLTGVQGHSAYPDRYVNPLTAMADLAFQISSYRLDEGNEFFPASNIAITSIDTMNNATNVVPAHCTAHINIRFNNQHSVQQLFLWLEEELQRVIEKYGVAGSVKEISSCESFITPPGELSDLVARSVTAELGTKPQLTTTGGTSDARFMRDHCPVVEFGVVSKTIHQVDEHVSITEISGLMNIYSRCLREFFA